MVDPQRELRHSQQPRHQHARRELRGDPQRFGSATASDSAAARYRHVTRPIFGSSSGAVTARRYPGSTLMSLSFTSSIGCRARSRQFRQHSHLGVGRARRYHVQRNRNASEIPRCSRSISAIAGSFGSLTPNRISNSRIILRGVRADGFVEIADRAHAPASESKPAASQPDALRQPPPRCHVAAAMIASR